MRATLAVALLIFFGCGSSRGTRPLGGMCTEHDDCGSGVCGGDRCLESAGDDDVDGLTNASEIELGSDPLSRDTDGDGTDDRDELTDELANRDSDGDGKPDIVESRTGDADQDCITDEADADDAAPGNDLTPMIALVCRLEGICAEDRDLLAVRCPTARAVCDYGRIAGFASPEIGCDGLDEDCSGEADEGFPDTDDDGVADCVDPDFAPPAPSVVISPASPSTDDALVASVSPTHARDGAAIDYIYRWERNGVETTITVPRVAPEETERGDRWRVRVAAFGGALATAEVVIGNSAPTCGRVIVLPTTGHTETHFRCLCQDRDDRDAGDPVLDHCEIASGGRVVSVDADRGECLVDPRDTDRGEVLACTYVAGDGESEARFEAGPVLIDNAPPSAPEVALTPGSGNAATAFTCSASGSTDVEADPITFLTAWLVNGNTTSEAGTTTVVTAGQLARDGGQGARRGDTITCRVSASDGIDLSTAVTSDGVVLGNSAPSGGSVLVKPPSATEGTTLTCEPSGASDPDGDELAWTYAWQVGGITIEGETEATLTGASFERGDVVTCTATPTDGIDGGVPIASKNEVVIGNTLPSIVRVRVSPPEAARVDTVTCAYEGWSDADLADVPSARFAWIDVASGIALSGQTAATLRPTMALPGDRITCRVTPLNGSEAGVAVDSETVRIVDRAPSIARVTLGPTGADADALLLCTTSGLDDAEDDPITLAYRWYVDGVELDDAFEETLVGVFAKGDQVRCAITPNDGWLDGAAVFSNAIVVGNRAPTLGSVSLTPPLGTHCDVYTCSPLDLGDPDVGDSHLYSYRWTRNNVSLPDRTATFAARGRAVPGDDLRCFVVASDGTGSSAEVASNIVTVTNTPPTVADVRVTPAVATLGDLLTCEATGFADAECQPTPTFEYRWFDGAQPIAGATTATFATDALAPGAAIACQATPFDGWARGTPKLSSPVVLTNTAPTAPVVSLSAPSGAGGAVTCNLVTPGGDSGAVTHTWHWRIGTTEHTGSESLAAAQVADCDAVACWVVASDGFSSATSNVAELVLPFGADCDDANPCTRDACGAAGGCVATSNDSASCADGDLCDGTEFCQGGRCRAGTPVDCSGVTEACLQMACNPSTGQCNLAKGDGTSCADANACDGIETCQSGSCTDGTPPVCNDDNACTADACDTSLGCTYTPVGDGTACTADEGICGALGVCGGGTCGVAWQYTRTISIAGGGADRSPYVVAIELDTATPIAAGKMRADALDVRFTQDDAVLPWWIESGLGTTTTRFRVRVDNVPAAGTEIRVHYGNASATDGPGVNRGADVFDVFDEFEDGVIDPAVWAVSETHPSNGVLALPTESGGLMRFPLPGPSGGGADFQRAVQTVARHAGSHIVEMKMTMNNVPSNPSWKSSQLAVRIAGDARVWAWENPPAPGPFAAISSGWWSNVVQDCSPQNGTYDSTMVLDLEAGTFEWTLGGVVCATRTGVIVDAPFFYHFDAASNGTMNIDLWHFRARPYVSPEPVAGALGAEEWCGPPERGWASATPIPAGRYALSSEIHEGHLFAIGGYEGPNTFFDEVFVAPIGANGEVGPWAETTSLPQGRAAHQSIVVGDHVYVLGGAYAHASLTADVVVGTLQSGGIAGWIATTALPSARQSFAVVAHERSLYAIGGNSASGNDLSDVLVASVEVDGSLGPWVETTPLELARELHAAFISEDYLYVSGGASADVTYTARLDFAPILADGSLGPWTRTTDVPAPISWHASAVSDGIAYIIGGNVGGGPSNCSTHVRAAALDLDTGGIDGSWFHTSPLPTCRAGFGFAHAYGNFYVVGGLEVDTSTTSVLVWSPQP